MNAQPGTKECKSEEDGFCKSDLMKFQSECIFKKCCKSYKDGKRCKKCPKR